MGSVAEGGVDRGKVREYYGALERALGQVCSKCWAHELCGGFCPWTLSKDDGTVTPPEEADCDSMRGGIEATLAVYVMRKSKIDAEASSSKEVKADV